MPMITVGGTAYDVVVGSLTENIVLIGAAERAFSGRLRSTVRAEKSEWPMALGPMTQTQYLAFRAQIANGAQQVVPGDYQSPGAGLLCWIELREGAYIEDTSEALGYKRIAHITARQA